MLRYAAIALLFMACSGTAANVAGPIDEGGRKESPQAATVVTVLDWPSQRTISEPGNIEHSPPADVRMWFYNHGNLDREGYNDPSGDCVQVSFGMHGVRCNDDKATLLAFESEYGPAIRGGSTPSRVADYCRQRGIQAYSVTSNNIEDTYRWAVWAADTGRGAAIGFGTRHFQFLCGRDGDTWLVCDNNSPWRVDRYTDKEFRAMHARSGFWIVVLDCHSPPPPITEVIDRPKPRQPFNPVWQILFGLPILGGL